MKALFSTIFVLLAFLANAAQPTGNIPISAMAEATNALDTAYVPIIQPYPGRTTNDNFKVSVASLFDARPQAIITNLTVYNFTVISNFFSTTTNITAYEITVTNNISHDRIFISTNITINGFDINTWTNDNQIFHPTINRGAGPLDYSFLVASNIVRVEDGRMSGTETWVSKSVALNIGDNQLPVAGNSQWNLIAATSNPDDTTISLMNGITDAQKLVIYNITNAVPANGAFKLTNGTPIPDSLSGGIARLMGGRDWVATNGSWIMLEFHSPDWVEMDDRNVFTGAGGADTWHVVNGILQPVNLALPVEIDSSLILGPSAGGTNVIYRTNNYAFVFQSTDVANRSEIWFTDEAGDTPAEVGMVGGTGALLAGASTVQLQSGANGIVMDVNHARPINTLPFSWGDQELPFTNFWGGVYYIGGYELTGTITNTINYSRGALYHLGTNDDFVIDSQSDGIAGVPRPISFRIGGTNSVRIANDIGPWPNDPSKVFDGSGHWKGMPPVIGKLSRSEFLSTNVSASNLSVAYHDLWTVPAGYWATVTLIAGTTNSSTIIYPMVKTNGVYYLLNHQAQSTTTNTPSTVSQNYIFEENETISATNTVSGVNIWARIIYWPKAVSGFKVFKQFGMDGSSTNLVYTCPPGKSAFSFTDSNLIYGGSVNGVNYFNGSASTAHVAYFECNGCVTPDFGERIKEISLTTLNNDSMSFPPLQAGDSLFVWSDLNNPLQLVWFTAVEVSIP